MSVSMPTILQPGTLSEVVSRVNVTNTRLQNFFGRNKEQRMGRNFAWDIFDQTREVEGSRMPGTGPARVTPQPVGQVNGTFPRVHSSIQLPYESLGNIRQLGGIELDPSGESYITRQITVLKQKYVNHVEMQYAAMLRGQYYYSVTGDDLIPSLSSGTFTIDYQIPSGNKSSLNMMGAGNIISALWSSASTDIPAQLNAINAAFEQLTGRPLEHVWLSSVTMNYVLTNDKVKALSGTANVVFDQDTRDPVTKDRTVVLKGIPWLTFHVTDGVLAFGGNGITGGTSVKLIPDGYASFCVEPDPSWTNYLEGSEVVVEYPGASPTMRYGQHFWAESTTKPAGYELIGVLNGLPALYAPKCLAYGTVA